MPYHIAGNFQGRNFRKFQGIVAILESFFYKIGGRGIFRQRHQRAIRESFLPRKFPAIRHFLHVVVNNIVPWDQNIEPD